MRAATVKRTIHRAAAAAFAAAALMARADGQYSIDWHKISGGGGSSAAGQYSITGTIGQADASGPMSAGNYSVVGGFWGFVSVVQTPGVPLLSISLSGPAVIVSWPDTGSFTLQQNSDVAGPGQWTASAFTVTTANGTNSVSLSPSQARVFFRLKAR